jgi:hypothetical protein
MLREERKKEGIYLKDFSGRKERQKLITPRWESYFFVIKRNVFKDAYYVLLRESIQLSDSKIISSFLL